LKPADFRYHRPRDTEETLALLKEFGEEAKILAGGQSLMPLMNFRLAQPVHLIDINFITEMDYVKDAPGRVEVGCLTRQAALMDHPLAGRRCRLLGEALAYVGYEQTRNRGTLCGSLAHADPAAELPAVLLALDGSVIVANAKTRRKIAARDLFRSYLTTSLDSDEMILEASIPDLPSTAGWSFVEFARRYGDFAIVGVAVVLVVVEEKISDARIALTGVGEKAWRERKLEEILMGEKASENLFSRVADEVAAKITPGSDIHASASYRRSLAKVLTRRALTQAWRRRQKAT
jgi:CO/xanthine dehydrogenase FAD-binding subunit